MKNIEIIFLTEFKYLYKKDNPIYHKGEEIGKVLDVKKMGLKNSITIEIDIEKQHLVKEIKKDLGITKQNK